LKGYGIKLYSGSIGLIVSRAVLVTDDYDVGFLKKNYTDIGIRKGSFSSKFKLF